MLANSNVLYSEKLNVRDTKQTCDMEQNKCQLHLMAPPLGGGEHRKLGREREEVMGERKEKEKQKYL